MQTLDHALRSVFHLEQFRPHQREIIEDVLDGHDTLGVMPTGAGKSLCFQLPAVVLRGLTIVVSPLISLMADQVRQLRALKVPAHFLNSSQKWDEQRAIYDDLRRGFKGLLYIAPERLSAESFQRLLPQLDPRLLVIDEAHCVSQWGHDFRPEYRRLIDMRKQLGTPVTMALTATATPEVQKDIVAALGLRNPKVHVTGFDRPNLTYTCMRFEGDGDKDAALLRFLGQQRGSGIVYCATRKAVEQVASLLESKMCGRTIAAYHAGMAQHERHRSQDAFMRIADSIAVATNAFGMGINKPELRFVVHYNLPGSLEAYYQEAGRAGRDGAPAECVLYHSARDLRTQRFFIDNIGDNNPKLTDVEIERLRQIANRKLEAMHAYASGYRCRRRHMLEYFGETKAIEGCRCDRCRSNTSNSARGGERGISFDEYTQELASRKSLARVTTRRSKTSEALRESAAAPLDTAAQHRLERLKDIRRELAAQLRQPAFCIMHDSALTEVASAAPKSIDDLARIKGVGLKKAERFGPALMKAYCLLPQENAAIPASKSVAAVPSLPSPALPSRTQQSSAATVATLQRSAELLAPDAASRLERLTQVRNRIAEQQKLPPYFILYDHALREVAEAAPTSIPELARIASVGDKKAAKFGAELLAAL